ncbi:MAG TPA: substrate-binding domain-containing protein [Saprospiraceae bacterium]|nr:substrate-binding domain-containing protein [Saprospiraceae bacterium]
MKIAYSLFASKKNLTKKSTPVLLLFMLFQLSCQPKQEPKDSSPTHGSIIISCDRALEGIIRQQEEIFERNYPYAHINLLIAEENEVVKAFLSDSLPIMIIPRDLDSSEIKYFQSQEIIPRRYILAETALAFIAHPESKDTALAYEQLTDLICNKPQTHFQSLIVENTKSGIARQLISLCSSEKFPAHIYSKENKLQIFDYVAQHPEALGVVDWSAISDSDDAEAKKLLSKVKLIGIYRPKDSIPNEITYPYQYDLQDKHYPFTRSIYLISRSGKNDLGLGFASFMAGEVGQKIMLKAGLLPKFQTERWIEIKNSDPKIVQ